jgi:uncharacterized protein with von Willebrand factor type A (vWA) domain
MQKKILEFTNILRKSGIRVSTAEAIDSFTALDELSIDDREIFRASPSARPRTVWPTWASTSRSC